MHGLEPQTIESIKLLKSRKTPFVVALNKIDRLYGWEICPNEPIKNALAKQNKNVIYEFEQRLKETILQFAEQGLNAAVYYNNKNFKEYVSLVPTSAHSGEGIADLLILLIQLTQKMMTKKLLYLTELQCTILEVKIVEGFGTTIDVILSNGELHEGDTIVVCTMNGPVVTTIRALLTPQPMREMRVTRSGFIHHQVVKAAQGIKIAAPNLDGAIAGSYLLVAKPENDINELKKHVMKEYDTFLNMVDRSGRGVFVQASTLGSLEALLKFLKDSEIPVAGVGIGPVHKKDVIRCSVMLDHDKTYAVMLCFDVKIEREARELADQVGVRIFSADIIYHLFDQFKAYISELQSEKQRVSAQEAVFPCILQILPNSAFHIKDPIVLGVRIEEGNLRIGTPIVVPSQEFVELGRVTSIERDHKSINEALKEQEVCIKIETSQGQISRCYGRHFEMKDKLYSKISRKSIDALKENFREKINEDTIELLKRMKQVFSII
eukprot:TRINITY_DN4220_c0_g1_i6.p1 TRINITY_DN4220_c0_g1~~TRINITY_DN4220_c0_g1_i6.p1  ORF type:complete len:493 (-),score=253.03 TRINITY_DN4220_c0_g1_i6:137-1615(-)